MSRIAITIGFDIHLPAGTPEDMIAATQATEVAAAERYVLFRGGRSGSIMAAVQPDNPVIHHRVADPEGASA